MKITVLPKLSFALVAVFALSFLLAAPVSANAHVNKCQVVAAEKAAIVNATAQTISNLDNAVSLPATRESQSSISESRGFARPPLVASRGLALPPFGSVSVHISRARRLSLKQLLNRYRGQADPPLIC